jgi:hypothetical protein
VDLEVIVQFLGHQPEAASAEPHLGPCKELDRRGDHETAFSHGEGRNIGPSSCQIEPHRRGGAESPLEGRGSALGHGLTDQF